ncbi:diiron oxygenase [Vibrio ouci]|uniref:AurF domain containing protein n=1 Tax=Vibrio ouci TaxID=2499078 RepID=A0A4Y8WIH7_9VIBR|nr:diiron oxygenase [Vibrio ouci]TFH92405.1 hypothetical protein ELS82_06995 [Vibrio ouci]
MERFDIDRFNKRCNSLSNVSNKNRNMAFDRFEWPKDIDENEWWYPRELLTVYGSDYYDENNIEQLIKLSKAEMVNQFSLNIHNERILINEILMQIENGNLSAEACDYLHHFVEEENQHMWYFNKFCRKYYGKVYGMKSASIGKSDFAEISNYLVFARIYIFEEVGDFINREVSKHQGVNELVRNINKAHIEEESRHISFGKAYLQHKGEELLATLKLESKDALKNSINSYMRLMVESSYNPSSYKDSGYSNCLKMRSDLIEFNDRNGRNKKFVQSPSKFFEKIGVI